MLNSVWKVNSRTLRTISIKWIRQQDSTMYTRILSSRNALAPRPFNILSRSAIFDDEWCSTNAILRACLVSLRHRQTGARPKDEPGRFCLSCGFVGNTVCLLGVDGIGAKSNVHRNHINNTLIRPMHTCRRWKEDAAEECRAKHLMLKINEWMRGSVCYRELKSICLSLHRIRNGSGVDV